MRGFFPHLVLICFLIIVDQLTKGIVDSHFVVGDSLTVVNNFFHITYVRNKGAVWGIGAHAPEWLRTILLLYVPLLAVGLFSRLLYKSLSQSSLLSLGYSLVIGGAIGNLFDRFTLGYVVDFFDVQLASWHWPAFNIADSCITIAAFLIGYEYLIKNSLKKDQRYVSKTL
ncbi:MAG: signal peptidase II [Halobacteriovoraceae bacterium]|nr:signal peptidase II [Halobacteriovoraceae bacterium]